MIGWEIERHGSTAVVREDGTVESDDRALADFLLARLREPVTVQRRGRRVETGGGPTAAIRLVPGDGRYMVARVRSLPTEDPAVQILRIVWAK